MSRDGVEILQDNEEADIADFMLNACGLELHKFLLNERVLTRENFEKNYNVLLKMVEGRNFRRAPYFVFGYFTLLVGAKLSERLRRDILKAADWKYEEGYWQDKGFAVKRRAYLEDFRKKISIHQEGRELHTASFKYSDHAFFESNVLIGLDQFQGALNLGNLDYVRHINLDGWGLKSIPQEIFDLKNLRTLSLEFNQIEEIPEELSNLNSLKSFYLNYNQLKRLPSSIGMLSSLKELSLIHNDIENLPKSIANLKKLRHIYVRGSKIEKLPKFLFSAKFDEFNHTIYLA